MNIRVKNDQIIAGPDVVPNPDGSHDVPAHVGSALVRAGHAETKEALTPEPAPEAEPKGKKS